MRPIKNWFVIPGETWHNIWSWLSNVFEKCFFAAMCSVCLWRRGDRRGKGEEWRGGASPSSHPHWKDYFKQIAMFWTYPEVEFVHPVSPGGSVKFVASGVNFSIFTNFLCFFLLKLLKLSENGGVKFLTWKSGGVKFWTNSMSAYKLSLSHATSPYGKQHLKTKLVKWRFLDQEVAVKDGLALRENVVLKTLLPGAIVPSLITSSR